MKRKKWENEELGKLLAAYKENISYEKMREMFSCTENQIRRALRKLRHLNIDVGDRRGRTKTITESDVPEILKAYQNTTFDTDAE